jgi:hypothetical protein
LLLLLRSCTCKRRQFLRSHEERKCDAARASDRGKANPMKFSRFSPDLMRVAVDVEAHATIKKAGYPFC